MLVMLVSVVCVLTDRDRLWMVHLSALCAHWGQYTIVQNIVASSVDQVHAQMGQIAKCALREPTRAKVTHILITGARSGSVIFIVALMPVAPSIRAAS